MIEAECTRPFGHARRKGAFRAGKPFGQHDRRIIAGDDHEAADQILDLDRAVQRGEHGRSMRRRTAVAPSVFADLEFIGQLDAARGQRFEHELGGHHLCRRRRRREIIGVFFEQHGERVSVDQNGMRHTRLQPGRGLLRCGGCSP